MTMNFFLSSEPIFVQLTEYVELAKYAPLVQLDLANLAQF